MLLSEQVKPFICHEEKIIREHAVSYLSDSYNSDADIMPLIIESSKRFGEEENSLILADSAGFTQSDISLHTVLEWLDRTISINAASSYNRIIRKADLSLLRPLIPSIRKHKKVDQITIDAIDRRLSFADCATETLWDELFAYSDEIKSKNMDQVNYAHGLYIVEALASRKDLPKEELLEILQDGKNYYRYDELYTTALAGEIRFEKAISILIDKLRIDAGPICDESSAALRKIGIDNVVLQLKEAYLSENSNFRLYAANIFGDIKMPLSEPTMLELLSVEKDKSIKTFIAKGVCNLISEDGMPAVKALIDNNAYDKGILDLRRPLYAVCLMLQINLKELESWREELYRQEQIVEQRIRSMERYFPFFQPNLFEAIDKQNKVKTTAVGRNDPCPCGSGKKFKKCCLK